MRRSALLLLLALAAPVGLAVLSAAATTRPAAETRMPAYDEEGALLLPDDHRTWILAGASLGLSYTEGNAGGHERRELLEIRSVTCLGGPGILKRADCMYDGLEVSQSHHLISLF